MQIRLLPLKLNDRKQLTVMLKGKQYFVMEEISLVFDVFGDVEFLVPQGCIFTFTRKPNMQVIASACMSQS